MTCSIILKTKDKVINYCHQSLYIGLTQSSCKILSINNVSTPFNGPEGPLCLNGKFTGSYPLEYTHLHHEMATRNQEKLISFTTMCTAHEHTGTRLQSIDDDLAMYAQQMAQVDDTITIIFADHGNTYTHFTHAVMEGRFEQYHPAMFMILPESVKQKLGDTILNNLRDNQFKLFTLLDVRGALISVSNIENKEEKPQPNGIFGPISNKRTCDDLDLRLPNLCVCEGWDAEVRNNTDQFGLLHFAVGQLNNEIQGQQIEIRTEGKVPRCKMLTPNSFYNVRERNKEGKLITSFDFMTSPGIGSSNHHEVFHVEIESQIDRKLSSRNMKLLNYDRISKYGPYRVCADKDVNPRLCVCDKLKSRDRHENINDLVAREIGSEYPKLSETADISIVKNSRVSTCLYLRKISYPEVKSESKTSLYSITYEVANVCPVQVNIKLEFEVENLKPSTKAPYEHTVEPYSVKYIVTAIRDTPYWDSSIVSETLYGQPV